MDFDFRADVERLFAGSIGNRWRVGAEAELLAQSSATGEPLPVHGASPALLPFLRELAGERGWREHRTRYGIPAFLVPAVGVLSFEPGGQLELSTRPFTSPSLLLAAVRGTIQILRSGGARHGIEFLEAGLEPSTPVEDAPFAFPVQRYARMSAHFERLGGEGLRMMRQSASFQLSLDVDREAAPAAWRVLNALAPFAIAAFANSPMADGRPTGEISTRSGIWQRADRTRTGIFAGTDPVGEYLAFALSATAFLHDQGQPRSMAELIAGRMVGEREWRDHLSTLFPEVRPRGYLEFRACDMVGDDGRAALLVLLTAIARDPMAREAIHRMVGAPDPVTYARAPLAEPPLLRQAAAAMEVALQSARREVAGFWSAPDLARAESFLHAWTASGRAPGHGWSALQLRSA